MWQFANPCPLLPIPRIKAWQTRFRRQKSDAVLLPETRNLKLTKWHFFYFWVCVVIFARGGCIVMVPIKASLNSWRAERFATAAKVEMGEGNYLMAGGHVGACAILSPDKPSVLRVQALYYSHYLDPRGLTFWQRLTDAGAATRADQLAHARLALGLLRTDRARTILKPLHLADPHDPEVLALIAEIFALDGDERQAIGALRDALSRAPDKQDYERRLGFLELRSSSSEVRATGKTRLFGLLARAGPGRAEIARRLLVEGRLASEDERLLLSLLEGPRGDSSGENLVRLVLELRQKPDKFVELLELHLPSADRTAEALQTTAELLGELGMHRAVLALIPPDLAVRDASLCLLRLGALATQGDWPTMAQLLGNPALPIAPAAQAIFRAGVSQLSGRTNDAAPLWLAAESDCHEQPKFMELLAIHAEAVGARDASLRAWELLLDDPFLAAKAAQELLRQGALWHDLRATAKALKRLAQMRPNQPKFRIQLALAQLLLGEEEAAAQQTLKELEPGWRNEPVYCVAASLAALRANAPDAAADWIERPAIQWSDASPVWRVVRVAALGQSGQKTSARDAAKGLKVTELTAQEYALVSPWLSERSESAD